MLEFPTFVMGLAGPSLGFLLFKKIGYGLRASPARENVVFPGRFFTAKRVKSIFLVHRNGSGQYPGG